MIMDKVFMNEALRLAGIAAQLGEIPVGAVVVRDGEEIQTLNICFRNLRSREFRQSSWSLS